MSSVLEAANKFWDKKAPEMETSTFRAYRDNGISAIQTGQGDKAKQREYQLEIDKTHRFFERRSHLDCLVRDVAYLTALLPYEVITLAARTCHFLKDSAFEAKATFDKKAKVESRDHLKAEGWQLLKNAGVIGGIYGAHRLLPIIWGYSSFNVGLLLGVTSIVGYTLSNPKGARSYIATVEQCFNPKPLPERKVVALSAKEFAIATLSARIPLSRLVGIHSPATTKSQFRDSDGNTAKEFEKVDTKKDQ